MALPLARAVATATTAARRSIKRSADT